MSLFKKIINRIKYAYIFNTFTPAMRKFTQLNRKFWHNIEAKNKDEFILVESYTNIPTHLNQAGRTAKALEEISGCTPVVIVNNFFSFLNIYTKLYKSFNIKKFIYISRTKLSLAVNLRAFTESIKIFSKIEKMRDFINLEYCNILIGGLVYDTTIRNEQGIYTVKKGKKLFKYLFICLKYYFIYENLFKKYKVKYLVVGDKEYVEFGLLVRMACERDIDVFLAAGSRLRKYDKETIRENFFHPLLSLDELKVQLDGVNYKEKIDNYLEDRFGGKLTQADAVNAYKDKVIYIREDLANLLNLDKELRNVFIFPHVFSDAPHCSKYVLFNDYYEWFEETLKLANNIRGVNWIIKPHPSSYMYGEEGFVERYLRDNNFDNIKVTPKDFSTASITDCADLIVTVTGTVGAECSALGIPVIICGKAFYSGYGFTIEPKSVDEYLNILKQAGNYEKLSKEQQEAAKIVLYHVFFESIKDDKFVSRIVLPGDINDPTQRVKAADKNFSELIASLESQDPHESKYFKYVKELATVDREKVCNLVVDREC